MVGHEIRRAGRLVKRPEGDAETAITTSPADFRGWSQAIAVLVQ
jgi:hypothetical protein